MRKTYVTEIKNATNKRTMGYSVLIDNPMENYFVKGTKIRSKLKVLTILTNVIGPVKAVGTFYRLMKNK
jgi:hypothetical protein